MIRFLLKGILRDKNRSLLPVIVVAIGAALTVFLSGYLTGAVGSMVEINAKFSTGHIKVTTRAYKANEDQNPIDLALLGVGNLLDTLEIIHPDIEWVPRIRFGGLIDVPDQEGETKGQGPSNGLAIDFSDDAGEVARLNIQDALVRGRLPQSSGEVLIGEALAHKLEIGIGDQITFFGSTMFGSMSFKNLTIAGTVRFGSAAMDKGTLIVRLQDGRNMLDMEDGATEILGFLPGGYYDDDLAKPVVENFNRSNTERENEFTPVMTRFKEQSGFGSYLELTEVYSLIFVSLFVFAMSIVLWNTGLIGSLRRYREYGIRLALGESKGHIFRSIINEALIIGIIGSVFGTFIGLVGSWAMQTYGIDISSMLKNSTMMMPNVLRSRITPELYYIGFIPGVFSVVLGNALSGIGIYKRQTAELFKELEV